MKKTLWIAVATLAVMTAPAFAQKAKQVEVKPEKNNPVQEWMESENKLIDTLNQRGKEQFLILRNKHSMVRTVRVVGRDVGSAVKACGKNNPEMKDTMDSRFSQWHGAVEPILDDADKFLQKEIDEQQLVYPSDFRHILKLNDKAYDYTEAQVKKEVVTSKAACEKLLASMDRTEDRMVELLQDILVPESVIRERTKN